MTDKNVWLITGAGRGLGLDIAKAALAAGHAVVATGRDPAKVTAALGHHDHLLPVKLDVTRVDDAQTAVETVVAKFGRIDVVVNNAGNFYAGVFEELSPDQVRHQIDTLLFDPLNVARAALPAMRRQHSGLLLTISSTAGIGRSVAQHGRQTRRRPGQAGQGHRSTRRTRPAAGVLRRRCRRGADLRSQGQDTACSSRCTSSPVFVAGF